jgi:hypothetical protein
VAEEYGLGIRVADIGSIGGNGMLGDGIRASDQYIFQLDPMLGKRPPLDAAFVVFRAVFV